MPQASITPNQGETTFNVFKNLTTTHMLHINEIFPGSGDYLYDKPSKFYFNLELHIQNAIGAYHGASVRDIINYAEYFNFNQAIITEHQVEVILHRLHREGILYKKLNLWFKS